MGPKYGCNITIILLYAQYFFVINIQKKDLYKSTLFITLA